MTPITAAPAFEHIDSGYAIHASTSELVHASLSEAAPWLYSALSQLHELQRAGRDLPGVGDLRITDAASTQIITVLAMIKVRDPLPTPTLYPISGGAVGMKWNLGSREVEVTTFANGNTVVAKIDGDQIIDDCELRGNYQASTEPSAYLGWLVAER